MDAAKRLIPLPSSCPELLVALAHIESRLCWVDQKPSESLKHAMRPIAEALIAKEVVGHHDMDVRILVLCCNCQILRIMARDPPYTDEQLKDFFDLATMMFEKLSFVHGERYNRLTKALILFRILKLPVVMLGLQQHSPVVHLFKQCLILAKSNTPDFVREMEMIMTNIIEECDEPKLVLELVRLLLISVRKSSLARLAVFASPVCQELGEKVLNKCAGLLKRYIQNIIRNIGIPLKDYFEIVAHICNGVLENEAMVPPGKQDNARKLRKDTAQKRKLDCIEGSNVRHCQQPIKHTSNPSISNDPIICVQGYKVKNSIALILEPIFMKYGDIAEGCVFKTTSLRASFLEVICEVVTQLQTYDDKDIISKMEEIERKVSEAEVANINVSWLRSHLEARKKSSLLVETKAKMSVVRKAAEMELMDAQKRFQKAERCVKVLALVEKRLDNNILDSKTEQDSWINQPIL